MTNSNLTSPTRFGQAVEIPTNQKRRILDASLDPIASPVWSLLVVANETPPSAPPYSAYNAIGRLSIGGGPGVDAIECLFDVGPTNVLIVPAAHIRLEIDCSILRVSTLDDSRARGFYTCMAIPFARASALPNYFTSYIMAIAAGGNQNLPVTPGAFVEAFRIIVSGAVTDANPFIEITFTNAPGTPVLRLPIFSTANIRDTPDWIPLPPSALVAGGLLNVRNVSTVPINCTFIFRLRV